MDAVDLNVIPDSPQFHLPISFFIVCTMVALFFLISVLLLEKDARFSTRLMKVGGEAFVNFCILLLIAFALVKFGGVNLPINGQLIYALMLFSVMMLSSRFLKF